MSSYEAWVHLGLTADAPADLAVLDSIQAVESTARTEELLDWVRSGPGERVALDERRDSA